MYPIYTIAIRENTYLQSNPSSYIATIGRKNERTPTLNPIAAIGRKNGKKIGRTPILNSLPYSNIHIAAVATLSRTLAPVPHTGTAQNVTSNETQPYGYNCIVGCNPL